ncbi:unnamed protein product [Caenorhabditis brenneri]
MISKPVKPSKIPIPVAPVSRRKWVIRKNCEKCEEEREEKSKVVEEMKELKEENAYNMQELSEYVEFVDWERALEVAEKNGLIEMWRQRSVELEIRLAQMERDAVIERDGHLERTQQVERLHEEKTNQLEARILQLESELGEALERSIMDVQEKLEKDSDDDFDYSSDDQVTVIEVRRGNINDDSSFGIAPPSPPINQSGRSYTPEENRKICDWAVRNMTNADGEATNFTKEYVCVKAKAKIGGTRNPGGLRTRWKRLYKELCADFDTMAEKWSLNDETKEKLAGFLNLNDH